MLKGFKDFILRGNVVDLAVAVVVGAAFTAIVTSFTKSIIEPLINAVTPPSSPGFGIQLVEGKENTYIDLAAIITAAINFVIVAAVVYFVIVLPLNTLKARRKRGEESGPAEPTDVELLAQIRDLLAEGRNGVAAGHHARRRGPSGDRRRSQRRAPGLTRPPALGAPHRAAGLSRRDPLRRPAARPGSAGVMWGTIGAQPLVPCRGRWLVRSLALLVAGDVGQHIAEDLVEAAAHRVRQRRPLLGGVLAVLRPAHRQLRRPSRGPTAGR